MIRYLLRIPRKPWERPEWPRREVVVALISASPDALAELRFDGDDKDVRAVRDALLYSASGERGAVIEADTTPIHLMVAMGGPVMKTFEPERLEGGSIFQPSANAFEEDLNRLAGVIATLFSETLAMLPSFDNQARADLIERLRLILALCSTLCGISEGLSDAGVALASKIQARLEAAGMDEERLRQTLRESYEFLEVVLLYIPQTGRQAAEMLRRLARFISEPAEADLRALCEDLQLIWRQA